MHFVLLLTPLLCLSSLTWGFSSDRHEQSVNAQSLHLHYSRHVPSIRFRNGTLRQAASCGSCGVSKLTRLLATGSSQNSWVFIFCNGSCSAFSMDYVSWKKDDRRHRLYTEKCYQKKICQSYINTGRMVRKGMSNRVNFLQNVKHSVTQHRFTFKQHQIEVRKENFINILRFLHFQLRTAVEDRNQRATPDGSQVHQQIFASLGTGWRNARHLKSPKAVWFKGRKMAQRWQFLFLSTEQGCGTNFNNF